MESESYLANDEDAATHTSQAFAHHHARPSLLCPTRPIDLAGKRKLIDAEGRVFINIRRGSK